MKKKCMAWFLIFGLMYSLCGCGLFPEEEEVKLIPTVLEEGEEVYNKTPVLRGELRQEEKLTASYVPFNSESLEITDASLPFLTVNVAAGDHVEEGDVLAEQDCTYFNEKIASCEEAINYASVKLRQLQNMRYLKITHCQELRDAVSPEELENMQTVDEVWNSFEEAIQKQEDILAVKQMELEEWTAKRDDRRLIANISGTVTYVAAMDEKGYLKSSATKQVFTISDSDASYFMLKTDLASYFSVGDEYVITVGKNEYNAVVADPAKEEEKSDNTVYFALTEPASDLKKNDRGNLVLVLEDRKDVLYVRTQAVMSSENEYFVYYEGENGLLQVKNITIGLRTNLYTEVTGGLEEGELVIIR